MLGVKTTSRSPVAISVVTPSVRPEGLELVERSLAEQSFQSFEWIVASPSRPVGLSRPFRWVADPPRRAYERWTLNRVLNATVRASQASLLVSWQDFTAAGPDTLGRFWRHYCNAPRRLVSGAGHKYGDSSLSTRTWTDPRLGGGRGPGPCPFAWVEFNLCSLPREAALDVGGFDEWLDRYLGMDGYSLLDRLDMVGGWEFWLDPFVETRSLEHARLDGWQEHNALGEPYLGRRLSYLRQPRLGYLDRSS